MTYGFLSMELLRRNRVQNILKYPKKLFYALWVCVEESVTKKKGTKNYFIKKGMLMLFAITTNTVETQPVHLFIGILASTSAAVLM